MCNEAVEVNPWQLYDVPDYLKTQEMRADVGRRDSYLLQFVPDWFVTQEQLEIWYDTMIIALMMNLLNSIKGIKNERLKKPQ